MSILKLLDTSFIDTGLKVSNRDEVLKRIAAIAKTSEILHRYTLEDIFDALVEREKLGTTGFGDGVAIPHCSFPDIEGFVVGFCRIPDGADFSSADGEPVYTLFFIIGPEPDRNRHIQILSMVSKILADKRLSDALRKAETTQAVLDILGGEAGDTTEFAASKERCLFQIVVQREEYFDQVMGVLSADVEGEIAVMEAQNAGYYLHRMPLFAGYWGKNISGFCRVILAVANRDVCNDIIRRINLISDDDEGSRGILVTAQNIFYSGGSLDF